MTVPAPVAEANPRVRLSTPLAILGMLVEVIRLRFKKDVYSDPALDWEWEPFEDTAPGNENFIIIESGFNTNIEARTIRPGIWVDRIQSIWQKSSIGHQDQMPVNVRMTLERFHAFGETDIIVDCTSPNRGESMMVGSITQDHLQMSANIIQAQFGLRDMSDIILNRTVKFDKDDKLWNSPIQFRIYYEVRWASLPVTHVMHSAFLKLVNRDNPEEYFREIATRSTYEP